MPSIEIASNGLAKTFQACPSSFGVSQNLKGLTFVPTADVAAVLHTLLDRLENRPPAQADPTETRKPRPVRCELEALKLPGYFSQLDPEPRLLANEQLQALEKLGLLRLNWLPGEAGHLLEAVALSPDKAPAIYSLLGRPPLAGRRARLESLLLGERFRFPPDEWRGRAVNFVLRQLQDGKSPTPFNLADETFNEDLMLALARLSCLEVETAYRVFSVRLFNDSKRLDDLLKAIVRLARLGQLEWQRLPPVEVLRELNLVANPSYLYLSGPWELVDGDGQALSLAGFAPAVGLSAAQAGGVQRLDTGGLPVLCIENPTTFYETCARQAAGTTGPRFALICLYGNPSPACRHLLRQVPEETSIFVWADLDYGGFNILAGLRRRVGRRCKPYRMDCATLEAHAALARPLTANDRHNLQRLERTSELHDVRLVIEYLLERGVKLEQEAIR